MSHWTINKGDRFLTRGGSVIKMVYTDYEGNFMGDNGFWYSSDEGRDGWLVTHFEHQEDLVERVKA